MYNELLEGDIHEHINCVMKRSGERVAFNAEKIIVLKAAMENIQEVYA